MHEVALLCLRGAAGGLLVVVFALIGEVLRPKAFSGLFSAAPSVALASLAITVSTQGAAKAGAACRGMVLGGIGMTACCVAGAVAIPRCRALWGSLIAWISWAAVALGSYWAVFIGAR